jgi:hypothetical protein
VKGHEFALIGGRGKLGEKRMFRLGLLCNFEPRREHPEVRKRLLDFLAIPTQFGLFTQPALHARKVGDPSPKRFFAAQ